MYRVIILPRAIDDLAGLDKAVSQRITDKLTWLSENIEDITPAPLHYNLSDFYKLKVGVWRAAYEIDHKRKVITVHKVGHRRNFYKQKTSLK